jgi:hypothetical protein
MSRAEEEVAEVEVAYRHDYCISVQRQVCAVVPSLCPAANAHATAVHPEENRKKRSTSLGRRRSPNIEEEACSRGRVRQNNQRASILTIFCRRRGLRFRELGWVNVPVAIGLVACGAEFRSIVRASGKLLVEYYRGLEPQGADRCLRVAANA